MKQGILITGASSGFGELAAKALAKCGHIVYASMRDLAGKGASKTKENGVDLLTVELDVTKQESADRATETIVSAQGRLDVVVHNAGHMTFGPLEAFTPEQIASEYDINVVSTQRVNRAALPVMRKQCSGLVVPHFELRAGGRGKR